MNRRILFTILAVLVCVTMPTFAFPSPVTPPNIHACADTDFFFWNDSSDLGGAYNKFAMYPQLQDGALFSATVSAATGEQTIGDFVTEPFDSGAIMAPGLTRYRVYLNVSSAVGVTTFDFIPYKVSTTGIETRLFYGVPRTVDVNNIATPTEYLVSYARRNYTYFEPGERLLIRVNASTTSAAPRTARLNVAGTTYASMAQIGYWICTPQYAYLQPQPTPVPIAIPVLAVLFAILFIIRGRK